MPQLPGALRHFHQEAILHQLPSLRGRERAHPPPAQREESFEDPACTGLGVLVKLQTQPFLSCSPYATDSQKGHPSPQLSAVSPGLIKTLWNDLVSPSLATNTSNLTSPPNGEFDLVSCSANPLRLAHATFSVDSSTTDERRWDFPKGSYSHRDSQKHFGAHETCIVSSLPPSELVGFSRAVTIYSSLLCVHDTLCDLNTLSSVGEHDERI